jgi:hypothetical protein
VTDQPTDLMKKLDQDMQRMFGRITPPEPLSPEQVEEGN